MARGDVVLVDLPLTKGQAGREQLGRRPAVAVQADSTTAILPTVVIVPFTSKLKSLRHPHSIRVEPSASNGLTVPSVLLVHQLRALDRGRIVQTLGVLEREYLRQLDAEIRNLLDIGT